MRNILSKIKELKYKIRSLTFEKEELAMSYGLTGKGSQTAVKGGEKNSPQERLYLKLESINERIKQCEEELNFQITLFKTELNNRIDDHDTRLIIEQRLLLDKTWQTIDTMRDLSVSRKQDLYYKTVRELESTKGKQNEI